MNSQIFELNIAEIEEVNGGVGPLCVGVAVALVSEFTIGFIDGLAGR